MTQRNNNDSRKRRAREFIEPESLEKHPIVRLFDNEAVKKITSSRHEHGLRFKDFQILLCKEPPIIKIPRGCSKKCKNCAKFKRCNAATYMIWYDVLREGSVIHKDFYKWKSNLAADLRRLLDGEYLRKPARGYYESTDEKRTKYSIDFRKRSLKKLLGACPRDDIQIWKDACFLFADRKLLKTDEKEEIELEESIQVLRYDLLRLTVRRKLADIAEVFLKRAGELKNAREKVHLRHVLLEHIVQRLGNLGLNIDHFKEELTDIRDVDLGVSEESQQIIEGVLKEENEKLLMVKRRVSTEFWTATLAHSTADRFEVLTLDRLFELPQSFKWSLKENNVDRNLREAFRSHHKLLSRGVRLSAAEQNTWSLRDRDSEYLLRDNGKLIVVSQKRKGEGLDLIEIERIRGLLENEQVFQEWFQSSEMFISPDVREEGPLVIIGL